MGGGGGLLGGFTVCLKLIFTGLQIAPSLIIYFLIHHFLKIIHNFGQNKALFAALHSMQNLL